MEDFTNAFRGGYRRRAFFLQYNLILLFGAGAFAAASASWAPLAMGAALELLWLLSAPWFSAFRHRVDALNDVEPVSAPVHSGRRLAARAPAVLPSAPAPPSVSGSPSSAAPTRGAGQSPDSGYRERARRLAISLHEIGMLADDELRKAGSEELAASLTVLSELSSAFERSSKLHERLLRFLSQSSKEDLERDVGRLTEAFSNEKDLGLRVTLRQALILAQRRLEQYGRIRALERATELRLGMIESAAGHVRSCGLTASSPSELAAQIRGLSTHVASVGALERDSAEAPGSQRSFVPSSAPPVAASDG